jgi:hypothetical protein
MKKIEEDRPKTWESRKSLGELQGHSSPPSIFFPTLHLTHNSDQVQIGKLRVRGYIPSLNICSPPQVAHIFCVYDEMTREPSMQYYK